MSDEKVHRIDGFEVIVSIVDAVKCECTDGSCRWGGRRVAAATFVSKTSVARSRLERAGDRIAELADTVLRVAPYDGYAQAYVDAPLGVDDEQEQARALVLITDALYPRGDE